MTAKLSRFPQMLHLTTISSAALHVKVRSRCGIERHVRRVVVLFAITAFTPTRVTGSILRPLPLFEQTVIGTIRAHNEIVRPVVRADVIDVVNFFLVSQESTESAFNHENVLGNGTASSCAGMIGGVFSNIVVTVSPNAAPPTRMELAEFSLKDVRVASDRMADAKEQGFAFALDPPSPVVGSRGDWGRASASTLTKTRRIQQSCAPGACADGTNIAISTRRNDV